MNLRYIALHHFGGTTANAYAPTQNLALEHIEKAHQSRWPDFKSSLGYYTGYNLIVWPNGAWTQTRRLGEETAAQRGHNLDTISICLAGNFSVRPDGEVVEMPTKEQVSTLKNLLLDLLTKNYSKFKLANNITFELSLARLGPHRMLQQTECYGNLLPDDWPKRIILAHFQEQLDTLTMLVKTLTLKLVELLQSKPKAFGSAHDHDCPGMI